MLCVCVCSSALPPLVRVKDEEQLVFTEVLRHPERLDLSEAVPEHLAHAGLRAEHRGQRSERLVATTLCCTHIPSCITGPVAVFVYLT